MSLEHAALALFVAVALGGCAAGFAAEPQRSGAAAALHQLFADRLEWELRESPERAMSRGDYRFADRIADASLPAIERRHRETGEFLTRLRAIDRAALGAEDQLSYDLFARELETAQEGHRFRVFLAPITGRSGPQQEIPQMHERVRFALAEDYANYLKRLEQTPKRVDDIIERMRLGLKEGRTAPRVAVAGVASQFESLLQHHGLDALAAPFAELPDAIDATRGRELRQRFDEVSLPAVRGAIEKLGTFFTREYLPGCRTSIAARDWPDGEAWYAFSLRAMTTTELSPRAIHEIGLREVARIRAEMFAVIRRSDFLARVPTASGLDEAALFGAFVEYLRTDPRFYHTSEDELLRGYRDVCKRVDGELPRLFGRLPRLPYGVRKIPDFMAPDQTTAYYSPGDIRNGESGFFYANTYALNQRPKYEMVPLALHEAAPGHHLQIALAQELENLPEFRRDAWFDAYGEGWALYAERLGFEMGLYSDPYDDFGRLLYEMWRACRLVVDPGIHALGWSREQAIEFMRTNTALSEHNINAEVDRYMSWPGQACAYKLGELKIREFRERAETALGPRFDLRAFHDELLGAGSLPLTLLETRMQTWIAQQSAKPAR